MNEPTTPDPWLALRAHTPARIALGRCGDALPTTEVLRFAAAHAMARDAVQTALDVRALQSTLEHDGWSPLMAHSRATDRATYLRRPDLGRRLDADSTDRLAAAGQAMGPVDVALVVADGLSAAAAQQHAPPLMHALRAGLDSALTLSPPVIATMARVALADEIGALLQARLVIILLGERPGLTAPDSLGAYLTFAPRIGRSDAERNCLSNIRPEGLPPAAAALRLAWLIHEALRRRLSGVALKEDSATAVLVDRFG
jgi:ethanolamine ammonia-lyase small subunit